MVSKFFVGFLACLLAWDFNEFKLFESNGLSSLLNMKMDLSPD